MGHNTAFTTIRLKTVFPPKTSAMTTVQQVEQPATEPAKASLPAAPQPPANKPAWAAMAGNCAGIRWSPHSLVYASIIGDWLMAVAASFLAFWLRFETGFREMGLFEARTIDQYGGYVAFGTLSLMFVLGKQGIYNPAVLLRSRWIADRILAGVVIWTLGFLAVTVVFKIQPPISRMYMGLNGVCVFVLLIVWRRVFNAYLRSGSRIAVLRQRTIFVGWNDEAARFSRSLKKDDAAVFDVLGWVSTGAEGEAAVANGCLPCLGSAADLERIIACHGADMVVLADLNGPRDQIVELANLCERELVSFKVIPSCFRIFVSGLHLETVAGTPILGVGRLPLDSSFNVLAKRAMDIIGGAIGLLFSAPVIAIFAAIVYLESRGSVFYRQRRTGMDGQPFDIIKIRSMRLDAEQAGGAKWCTKDDPRRLRIGAFMRKWNIDELPQFWNVIKGDMSLVGPRPERPELIAGFKHEIPHYQARHNAKPGMTGWAQVKGWRGDTDLGERIKCDLWYLENWNIFLDFQIMLLTFLRRDNAY